MQTFCSVLTSCYWSLVYPIFAKPLAESQHTGGLRQTANVTAVAYTRRVIPIDVMACS